MSPTRHVDDEAKNMKNQYVGIILGIFILIGIVLMNQQILKQVNDAYNTNADVVSSVAPPVLSENLATNPAPVDQPVQEEMPMESSTAMTEPAANEENGGQEEVKVIYQMPLDDVRLAQ